MHTTQNQCGFVNTPAQAQGVLEVVGFLLALPTLILSACFTTLFGAKQAEAQGTALMLVLLLATAGSFGVATAVLLVLVPILFFAWVCCEIIQFSLVDSLLMASLLVSIQWAICQYF